MTWYKTGSVFIVNGATVVNGYNTRFASNSKVGDGFNGPDGKWYEIVNIASEVTFGIYPEYSGPTISGSTNWMIAPIQGYNKESADRLREITDSLPGLVDAKQDKNQKLTSITTLAGTKGSVPRFDSPDLLVEMPVSDVGAGLIQIANKADMLQYLITTPDTAPVFAGRVQSTKGFNVGSTPLGASAVRDGYTLNWVREGLTDCHGFADSTLIQNVSDYGGYGGFDMTVTVLGAHVQNHVFSFQDRTTYGGTGELFNQFGLYSRPTFSGSGTWVNRSAVAVFDVNKTGSGVLTNNYGLQVYNMSAGVNNHAVHLEQMAGYSVYSSGVAPTYIQGNVSIGGFSRIGTPIEVYGPGTTIPLFGSSDALGAYIGTAGGNAILGFITNGGNRWQVGDGNTDYAFAPYNDGVTPLCQPNKRGSTIYLATAPVVTSDARAKTDMVPMNESLLKAGAKLSTEIGNIYQFLSAVKEKGDEARWHFGSTVQRAIEIMKEFDLDPFAYSFICHDTWEKRTVTHPAKTVDHPIEYGESEIINAQGQPISYVKREAYTEVVQEEYEEVIQEAGDAYSFRMDDLMKFLIAGMNYRVTKIEESVSALMSK